MNVLEKLNEETEIFSEKCPMKNYPNPVLAGISTYLSTAESQASK
jgi:hypothetical protein